MIASSTPSKFTRRRRVVLGGLLFLVLSIVLFAIYFYFSPTSVLRFYFGIVQHIDIGDAGLLSDVPCASPCVFGMQAGETRLDQVPRFLEANGLAASKCFTEPSVSWIVVSCGMGRFNVQVNAQTKIVNGIWFRPNTSISVGEILDKYGKPDYVAVFHDKLPEGSTILVYLFWDSKRMSIILPEIAGDVYAIEKATRIEQADFSDDDLYQASSEIQLGQGYKLWHGYGDYRQ